jgi:hypothetical protein
MTREQVMMQLAQEYAARREENLRRYDDKVDAVCGRCPGLRELLDRRHAALMNGIRLAMYPGAAKDVKANEGLSATLADYSRRIARKLQDSGLPADALAPFTIAPPAGTRATCTTLRRMCLL